MANIYSIFSQKNIYSIHYFIEKIMTIVDDMYETDN